MDNREPKTPKKDRRAERARRAAEALRANLRRRKAQARLREQAGPPGRRQPRDPGAG